LFTDENSKKHTQNAYPSTEKKDIMMKMPALHTQCGQMAGWIKMALGTDVGIGPTTLC